jgi:hypothetical protein
MEQGEVFISSDPQDAQIIKVSPSSCRIVMIDLMFFNCQGFVLNFMNMRDAATGKVRLQH